MSSREDKAIKIALEEGLETIIESHETPDFVQVTGKMGGDYITYRVMNDGSVYEK